MSAVSGRTVSVPAARLRRWVDGFAERHGGLEIRRAETGLTLNGGDGERAEIVLPYLPWHGSSIEDALADLDRARRTLVLVVRRGGYACAVVDSGAGEPGRVAASKVGSRYVQGRTAAGGWSQQRFARRRQKQTSELVGAAADVAARLLVPTVADRGTAGEHAERWLATGGDAALVAETLADPRLRPVAGLPRAARLTVGTPARDLVAVLPRLLLTATITLYPGNTAARRPG